MSTKKLMSAAIAATIASSAAPGVASAAVTADGSENETSVIISEAAKEQLFAQAQPKKIKKPTSKVFGRAGPPEFARWEQAPQKIKQIKPGSLKNPAIKKGTRGFNQSEGINTVAIDVKSVFETIKSA